jgi:hypothetical protein
LNHYLREELLMGVRSELAGKLYIAATFLLLVQIVVGFLFANSVTDMTLFLSVCLAFALMLMLAIHGAFHGDVYPLYQDEGWGHVKQFGEIEVGVVCGLIGPVVLVISVIVSLQYTQESGFVFIPVWLAGLFGTLGLLIHIGSIVQFIKKREQELSRLRD